LNNGRQIDRAARTRFGLIFRDVAPKRASARSFNAVTVLRTAIKAGDEGMDDWKRILIAVNDSDDAMRAIHYVGQTTHLADSISIHLLYVHPDPPPDYYTKGGTLDAYREIMYDHAKQAMKTAISTLKKLGVNEKSIKTDIQLADGRTISQAILQAQETYQCSTVVVGKRGISKNEEFLFGSISNTLARKTKGFTTWIVG
jgi:nucleotide-binding universal stress UspA family protein